MPVSSRQVAYSSLVAQLGGSGRRSGGSMSWVMAAGGTLHGAQDYGLQRPTREDLLEALLRSGSNRQAVAAWQVSCRRLGHSPSAPLGDEALEDLAVDLLRATVGPAALALRTFLIRLRTFHALEGDPRQ